MDLEPSRYARVLLQLAEREADGLVRLGGRVLTLRDGRLDGLLPDSSDASLVEFAIRAGWVEEQAAAGLPRNESEAALVALREVIGGPALRRARRSAWIDRLTRALSSAEADDAPAPQVESSESSSTTRALPSESLTTLVLEALTRRAADRDAGIVGASSHCILAWNRGATLEAREHARKWLGLEPEEAAAPLSRLFVRQPGAAPRVAAVVRAGLARLAVPGEEPRSSLTPARQADRDLTPGASIPPAAPIDFQTRLPTLPPPSGSLEDPLTPLESRVLELESMGAPGPDRADVWGTIAQIWQDDFDSLEEAVRAFREAAAADPTDVDALVSASNGCAALGQLDLARAYAHAAAAASAPIRRVSLIRREAELAARCGDPARAEELLRNVISERPSDAHAWRLLARLATDEATLANAEQIIVDGAAERAALMSADESGSLDTEAAVKLANLLSDDGCPEAGAQMLTDRAQASETVDERRRLRLGAAEIAEDAGRHDLATAALLAAHLDEPDLEVLYEPLATDAARSSDEALHAVLLERFGVLSDGPDRAHWLSRAAQVLGSIPGESAWARELLTRAYAANPADDASWQAVVAASEAANEASFLAEAVERALVVDASLVPNTHLERLAEVAANALGSKARAHAAWSVLSERGHDGAAAKRDALASSVLGTRARLDTLLNNAALSDDESRELNELLRHEPSARERAITYHKAGYAKTPDRQAASALERAYRLQGDDRAVVALAIDHTSLPNLSDAEVVRFASIGSHTAVWAQSWGAAFQLLSRWLQVHPHSEIAVSLLEFTAREANDPLKRAEARAARLALPPDTRHVPALLEEAKERAEGDERRALLERALELDSRCAGALEMILECPPEPGTPLRWLASARAVLGERPRILRRAIDIALAANSPVASELANALLRAEGTPASTALEAALDREDPAELVGAARALIAEGVDDAHGHIIRAGRRLIELGANDDAAAVLLAAEDASGEGRFLAPAEAAAASERMNARVLERRLPWAEDPVPTLVRIAGLHRARRFAVGEARAWLRVLEYDPHHADALHNLQALYIDRGDDSRAIAALELEAEHSPNAELRRRAVQRIAAIAVERMDDPARASVALHAMTRSGSTEDFIAAAGTWVGLGQPERGLALLLEGTRRGDVDTGALYTHAMRSAEHVLEDGPVRALEIAREGLLKGARTPDLMLGFERLSLRISDVDSTRRVYGELYEKAMGRHGRRGIRYREARWLERAEDPSAAMEAYEAAFSEAPSDGVILSAIERLARTTGNVERLADALCAVADKQSDVDMRLQFERRIVAIYLDDLGSAIRAFERLAEAWELTRRIELVPELRRLARICDADRESTWERILAVLRGRVEASWNTEDQVKTLGLIAEILAFDLGEFEEAEGVVDNQLLPKLAEDEDVPDAVAAPHILRLAEALRAADTERALARAKQSLALDPDLAPARSLVGALEADAEARVAAPPAAPPDASGTEPASAAPLPSGSTRSLAPDAYARDQGAEHQEGAVVGEHAAPASRGVARWQAATTVTELPGEAELRRKHRDDEPGSAQELVDLLCQAGRSREASQVALTQLRRAPWDVTVVRLLVAASQQANLQAVHQISDALLESFGESGATKKDLLYSRVSRPREVIDGEGSPYLTGLGLVWEHASSLFKKGLNAYGYGGSPLVTAMTKTRLGAAVARAETVVGKTSVDVRRIENSATRVLRTSPPTVLVGEDIEHQDCADFRIAHALERARSPHILLSGTRGECEHVLEAVYAAFGPPSAMQEVSRDAAGTASELWRLIPAREQALIRATSLQRPNADEVLAEMRARASRAGFLADGRFGAAFEALSEQDELGGVVITDASSYEKAAKASTALAALVRFAFSNAYLSALTTR